MASQTQVHISGAHRVTRPRSPARPKTLKSPPPVKRTESNTTKEEKVGKAKASKKLSR